MAAFGTSPSARGRRLALYDAVAKWIAGVECKWRDRAPGEALVGPVENVLDPPLLDLNVECPVRLKAQCNEWVRGCVYRIPETAAREAERCLRAALDAYAMALQHSLDDQMRSIGAREGVPHWLPLVEPPPEPNALQCACPALDSCFDDPSGHRVPWRPVVDLASTRERVRIEPRPGDHEPDAVTVTIDRSVVELVIAGERTTHTHDGDATACATSGKQSPNG